MKRTPVGFVPGPNENMCPPKVTVVGCDAFVVIVCVTVLVVVKVRIALDVNKKYPPTTIDPTIKPMTKPPTSDHRKDDIYFLILRRRLLAVLRRRFASITRSEAPYEITRLKQNPECGLKP
jgi:hypothetical protein